MARPPATASSSTNPPNGNSPPVGRSFQARRRISSFLKVSGSIIALLSLVFTAYQFYESNRVKKRELAIAQVDKYQSFSSSPSASDIAKKSMNFDTKTYNLEDFIDKSSPQFRALLYYFNLINGIAYLYNIDVVDKDYMVGNLLCPVVKQYRTFVLAQTGGHGTVTRNINGSGVFKVGLFSELDRMYSEWNSMNINGSTVDVRCAANWGL